MDEVQVKCPECGEWVNVRVDYDDLKEGWMVEDVEGDCDHCDCLFTVSLYLDAMNKKIEE